MAARRAYTRDTGGKLAGVAALVLATVVAGCASASASSGGTLRWDLPEDVDYTDPALAYFAHSWQIEYATCLKLVNYPDSNGARGSRLVPEAATGLPRVSGGGTTYDFTVSAPWTRFSNGERVGPANFARAIERVLDPRMRSPGAQFVTDVAGARARLAGKARTVSGVRVHGKHLVVRLERPAPDFLARLAMPFFCAVPVSFPVDPDGLHAPPSAGPYTIAARVANRSLTLKRNPYYKGSRPHNVAAIEYTIGNSLVSTRLRVEKGEADVGPFQPSGASELAEKYGVNKRRFWVEPALNLHYLVFNHDRPLFERGGAAGNVPLMRAINYALDRRALVQQMGKYAGRATDQILPPGMPGYRDAGIYPNQPDLARARKLAAGHTGDGRAVLYAPNIGRGPMWAQVAAYDLKQIGLDVGIRLLPATVEVEKASTRGEPFDMAIVAWQADYPDPFDFLNVLLSGDALAGVDNTNIAYFDVPLYNRELRAAAALRGDARYRAYGSLDLQLMRDAAPLAPIANGTNSIFLSARVGCFTYSNVYGVDPAALCLE